MTMNIQSKVQQGFTLIELMIVIAIVGILAAIALPAYQDYVVRSKMSEPMAALAEAKTTISEFYATNNELPDSAGEAGITEFPNKEIVKSLVYLSAGVVYATVQDGVIPNYTAGDGFGLSARTRSDGSVVWICTNNPARFTNGAIVDKYLPASCRN